MNKTRTTITIPEEVLKQLKIRAAVENESVSKLITDSAQKYILQEQPEEKQTSQKALGSLNLGSKKTYQKRKDLYDQHIKRKMEL